MSAAAFLERGRVQRVKPKERRSARKLPVIWCVQVIRFEYSYGDQRKRVTIGLKARGDGASCHWLLRLIIDLFTGGMASRAFILHDILCQSQDIAKAEADFVLNEAMKVARFPGWMRSRIYASVRGSSSRNNWPQPDLTPILRADGLPGGFVECPVEIVG